jgi:alpha-L-fucosidase 2
MLEKLAKYNVVWDSPSGDSSGSMPLGNGDIGINMWVEKGGDLIILIGKGDAWDENASLLKLGRVRVRFTPNPFVEGGSFQQMLDLRNAEIRIAAGGVAIRVWVDANNPIVQIEALSDTQVEIEAQLEMWRKAPYTIKTQTSDLFKNLAGKNSDPHPTVVSADHVVWEGRDRIVWCHHNEPRENDGYEINMRLQGLGDLLERMPHPLFGRTFGGAIVGKDLVKISPTQLQSRQAEGAHRLAIHVLSKHQTTIDRWHAELDRSIESFIEVDLESARKAHQEWWTEFWNRSWIFVESPEAFEVTRGYVLQRFMNACAGRGEFPIKHNGSIFTVGRGDDPDFRRWGGPGFWFMNQRLIYWPMLAAGDFDLIRVWLEMYRQMLEVQKFRTRKYFGHGGAHFPETVMFWGAEVSAHYEWTPFEERKSPEAGSPYLKYYWSGGIELTLILLEYFEYTGDDVFAREMLWPMADAITEFFDLHYRRDEKGKIRFEPGQALETWHEASNPLPEVVGLRYLLGRLVELKKRPSPLPSPGVPGEGEKLLQRWRRILGELPEIPVGEKEGVKVILPAERFDKKKNTENPELYGIFPYRIFGVGKADLKLARDTFAARLHKSHECWSQDEIQMALLGLTAEVKESLMKRASAASHSESRFPGFWNAFKDWLPDVDHGGVLQMALQLMLMQCEGEQILLLPAWPGEWDVDFKLHAPRQTIVEGKVREGRVVELSVTPESRRKDVVIAGE